MARVDWNLGTSPVGEPSDSRRMSDTQFASLPPSERVLFPRDAAVHSSDRSIPEQIVDPIGEPLD